MSLNHEIQVVVAQLVPDVYAASLPKIYSRFEERLIPDFGVDMSQSSKCHVLTKDLFDALKGLNIPAKRELHQTEGFWHYVINHSPEEKPSDLDIITDLNPWAFRGGERYSGYLHGERSSIQEILRKRKASETHIALRGIATITEAHTEPLMLPELFRRQ